VKQLFNQNQRKWCQGNQ